MKFNNVSKLGLQQEWINKWDGKLPQYILGSNQNFMMQMPSE